MCIFSGRFDAVEDSLLRGNLQSAARRVYSRYAQPVNAYKNNSYTNKENLKT